MLLVKLTVVLFLLLDLPPTRTESVADFIQQLLDTKHYNKKERPYLTQNQPVTVDVDVFINSISSISEITMNYFINMYLRQRWRDPRLAFMNNTQFNESVTLNYETRSQLWVPDLFIRNEQTKGSFHDVTVPNVLLKISPEGDILFSQRISSKLSCDMDLHRYPLDHQSCELQLESYGYTTKDLIFQWKQIDKPVQVNEKMQLPEFNLTKLTPGTCTVAYTTGAFSCIFAKLDLTRLYQYYLIQVYVPSILIVILSWVSFWIDIHAVPARISLGLLTVLTITTQASGISSKLPRVSYIKAIDVWMFTNTVFVFGALIEYSVVNVLARGHKDKMDKLKKKKEEEELAQMSIVNHEEITMKENGDGPSKFSGGTEGNGSSGTQLRHRKISTNVQDPKKKEKKKSWCAKVMSNSALLTDVISRIMFPGSYVVFNCLYWIFYL